LQAVTEVLGRWIPEATPERVCGWIDRGAAEPGDEFWTLDPIDGTKGFLRGDQYVVALALIVDGQPKVGALGCPNLHPEVRPDSAGPGSVAIAVAGEGAWIGSLEGAPRRPLRVSTCEQPVCGRMLRSFESAHTNPAQIKALGESMGLRAEPVLMDSQAKYVMLAGGEGEVIFRLLSPARPDYVEKIWDHAAGSLIVEEAGGRVTDLRGERLDFGGGRLLRESLGVLATNQALHDAALRALEQVGANRRPEGV
jgi:3'(2'), 5'-bisphosphate nucleotidase